MIRALVAMKGGITWLLVLFAIGYVDAIQCYECAEKSQDERNKACNGDDLGELMDCPGWFSVTRFDYHGA